MATRVQFRRGTAAQWTSTNPVLAAGEPGTETDTGKTKVGNGSATWSALPYLGTSTGGGSVSLVDNGDGTFSAASSDSSVADNGDGTYTITA